MRLEVADPPTCVTFLLPSYSWIIFKDDVGKMEIRTKFWSENRMGSDGMGKNTTVITEN